MRTPHVLRTTLVVAATLAAVLAAPAAVSAAPTAPATAAAPAQDATTAAESITGLSQIVAGNEFACGLGHDAKVYCWGRGSAGVLGNGGTDNTYLPVAATTTGTALAGKSIKQISAGTDHVCALASDGTVACWGNNDHGQLGDGTTDTALTAVGLTSAITPITGKSINMISAGGTHTCVRTTDNTLACWGNASSGRLGNGATGGTQLTPVLVNTGGSPLDGKAIAEIEAGRFTTCVLTSDGAVACWGSRFHGGIGDG
ncbi:MAG: hypothetical protein KDB06_15630, partial [Ilumatobacter sp.]|nr:hypothetical protein [Ilumatobacter sp.]